MQKRKPKTKPKPQTQQNTYDETLVDVSDISNELTTQARRFVFWFCFPGSNAFQNKTRAAIAAGYSPNSASKAGYKLCHNQTIVKEIERISKSYNSETIDALYQKYINTLETRAFFDPADYISGATFKKIEDIAPEKRVCLEQPVINRRGKIVGYTFGSRRSAMAEVKELHAKEHFSRDGYDDEETKEIILERITIREAKRMQRPAEMYYEIVEDPIDRPEDTEEAEV